MFNNPYEAPQELATGGHVNERIKFRYSTL